MTDPIMVFVISHFSLVTIVLSLDEFDKHRSGGNQYNKEDD